MNTYKAITLQVAESAPTHVQEHVQVKTVKYALLINRQAAARRVRLPGRRHAGSRLLDAGHGGKEA